MSRDGWRPHIESALSLDLAARSVAQMIAPNVRRSGSWYWPDSDGDTLASVAFAVETQDGFGTLTLRYCTIDPSTDERESITCRIALTAIPLHFGGSRWWMLCPYTHRLARKLYKFDGIDQFCHRTAVRPLPTYASQRVSGLTRLQHKRWTIRRKLGDDCTGLFDEPMKPKWMRWRTFRKHAARDAELAGREDAYMSPALLRLLALEMDG